MCQWKERETIKFLVMTMRLERKINQREPVILAINLLEQL